jgi:DNA modification methylase
MIRKPEQKTINGLTITYRAADSLTPYANNPRTHSASQIDVLVASLKEFGWTNPILLDGNNGVIAGAGRLMAAKKLGLTSVPCIDLRHLTPTQRRAYVIADNEIALLAGWNDDLLRSELEALKLEGLDIAWLGFDDAELASILNTRSVGATDPDDAPPVPVNPVASTGDIWHLGRHRLLCGNACERADVEALLAGAQPHLMVTDPPYGVNYDADWRNSAQRASGQPFGGRAVGKVTNDDCVDWRDAWTLFKGDVAYVWHGALHVANMSCQLTECGFELRALIVWAKNNFAVSRGHYHWQHETLWYTVRKGRTAHWAGDRSQTTLWCIDKPLKSETGHSTQKPIECMLRPMVNNSQAGDWIYDPFVGSGSSIIAAEMAGRNCFAIEINPAYIDVCIQRFENFTEQQATLDGKTFAEVRNARLKDGADHLAGPLQEGPNAVVDIGAA